MALALLYNITGENAAKLGFALFKLGIARRQVTPEEYALPVGTLAGIPGLSARPEAEEVSLSREMLVLHQISDTQLNALLAALRRAGATVALKAVVTETNAAWSSYRLYREISAEHEAMAASGGRSASRQPLHETK